jgi:hypothetical protein
MIDCHWKSKDIVRLTNLDVTVNSSVLAWHSDNPKIHNIWNHFNSGYKDYYLRKYVGIDRFLAHEPFEKDLFDYFPHDYIMSYKYESHNKMAPVITFEELDFGSIDTASYFYFVDHGFESCYTRSYYNYPLPVTYVGENQSLLYPNVFPNPFVNTLNISNDFIETNDYSLALYSLEGEVQIFIQSLDTNQINTSHLDSGIYFAVLKNETSSYFYKLLKQ